MRKPLAASTVAGNVLAHGVGALNIGASRVEGIPPSVPQPAFKSNTGMAYNFQTGEGRNGEMSHAAGRWPANLLFSHSVWCAPDACAEGCPVAELDAQSLQAGMHSAGVARAAIRTATGAGLYGIAGGDGHRYGDTGGASRYFPTFRYQAKASRAERNRGCEGLPTPEHDAHNLSCGPLRETVKLAPTHNGHPTVKPLKLMLWLITLITPPGGVVLDPFAGSGSTLVAAKSGGWRYIGIEREAEYVAIAQARLAAVSEPSLGSAIALEQPKPVVAKKPSRKRQPAKPAVTPLWESVV